MLLRPDVRDVAIIGLYTGRVATAIGLVMAIPALYGFVAGEIDDALAFVLSGGLAVTTGQLAEWRLRSRHTAQWHHGMLVAAMAWLVAPFFGALPLYLSGHYGDFVGAYFDAMSGFATAGLSVINDLDHLSDSMQIWRHLLHFLGGQGLVVMVLSLFATGGGSVGMYVGEAREDKILPNVVRTSRFIWRVSLSFGAVGSAGLAVALLFAGLPWTRALFHAPLLFMAAFDTGGFAPMSSSVAFYHSLAVELVLMVLMVAGALSFALHYQLWHRRPGEILRNSEVRFLALTVVGSFTIAAVGFLRIGEYGSAEQLFRKGFFHIISAHTGTGFQTVPGPVFVNGWGTLAPAMVVVAMGLGGMAGSTAGGIKGIRSMLVLKTVQQEIRRVIRPPTALTIETYHAGTRRILRDDVMRAALMILLLYMTLYLVGALVGMFYGYEFDQAMFESTSAAAAVGLSSGITGPSLPTGLMVTYTLQMWIGRLEFIAIFALFGYLYSAVRGRA